MPTVELERIGSIARITLNRPEKLNAIDHAMLDELGAALDAAERSSDVRAILLDGNGRAFSAGFDMTMDGSDTGESRHERLRKSLTRDFHAIMRFWDCPKPIVAAVHGYCLGSAMEITALCDVTLAADDCRFGAPEVRYGSGIVCLVLPWIIGLKNASEMLLTGDNAISAERAAAMGLVNRVVPAAELRSEARAVAEQIAANDVLAVRLTKKAIHDGAEMAGLRRALENGLDSDISIESSESSESITFNEILDRDGLKAALSWRASQHAEQEP